jgi:hypothetical protein
MSLLLGAAFTLLREGDAWLDEQHSMLVAVERIAECPQPPAVDVHRYMVPAFYGFRGEDPGQEEPGRADYSGYSGLHCLYLRVTTRVPVTPGSLDARLRLGGIDGQSRYVHGGGQVRLAAFGLRASIDDALCAADQLRFAEARQHAL